MTANRAFRGPQRYVPKSCAMSAYPPKAVREWFETTGPLPNWPPNYNVGPTHIMPVIRPLDGGREIVMMEWGLIPFFSEDGKRICNTFNARCEEVRTRNSYREPFKTRRCIVPAAALAKTDMVVSSSCMCRTSVIFRQPP